MLFDLAAGSTLGVYMYTIWTGQWHLVPWYAGLTWLALYLWFTHRWEQAGKEKDPW